MILVHKKRLPKGNLFYIIRNWKLFVWLLFNTTKQMLPESEKFIMAGSVFPEKGQNFLLQP